MSGTSSENIHGTALVIGEKGLLIRGPSGSGKSSLCLSLLRRAPGQGLSARLVADDRVDLSLIGDHVHMKAPARLQGLIEVAGFGIVRETVASSAILALVIDLEERSAILRMPEPGDRQIRIANQTIARIALPAREASFCADILLTLLAGGHV
ncbi:Hpr(Ser) kinase/phosphatase [Fulvimarina manganoxydans]|uniref:Hpr(Ser) kinase/phosphatase n=1 Tax=Fulvimarina manganoxydans TaxID=937218 RepID=A0A1W2EHZ0_9HYPH|nr:hypothetical protein [Fulvimarina manganoxydans]SMD08946.1 Hpr(Ser) kinase/phosphatase [Fulvimarina manganoxydans]